ncbi:P-loop containing nucleoside triphosphate hydrolase protein [Hypoxylon argillaceum]|nr:P-loop containing nucleoside triphosphate hydrolase protein [Hypoxylon argillaceum]
MFSSERGESGDNVIPGLAWNKPESKAKEDWEYQKTIWPRPNAALDELMDMVGLEVVKRKFIQLNTFIQTTRRQKLDISERFGAVFVGNPGTGERPQLKPLTNDAHLTSLPLCLSLGKSQVAKKYADFLYITGRVPVSDGIQENGGILLVEEAHQMMSTATGSGGLVLDYLLSEVENLKESVVFLFAGHGKQMETFCAYNPAFHSLIPTTINFPNYLDHELHLLLIDEIKSRFRGNVVVEGGYDGHLMRVVARRIGRGRDRHSFGNARDVQTTVSAIHRRQADRLFRSMKAGTHRKSDDLVLSQEDLLGPPPSVAFNSGAWDKLKAMTGLNLVKSSIEAIIHRLQLNYERELAEKPLLECSLNKLLLGNPGTGKTTVAKLYGQILADIGLLSNGEVVIKTPSELIGEALGQSERNTKAILDSTKGKVLIIDEAYMLGGGDKSPSTPDSYRTGVIDTIVSEVQSTAVEDRCVLLVGYRDRMESMLNEANPALARRFPLASAFSFEDYSQDELEHILETKLSTQGLSASKETITTALEVLARTRNRPGFGNAGEVDILLDQAKLRQHTRLLLSSNTGTGTDLLLPSDIDPDFERNSRSLLDVRTLFTDFVGNEALIQQLESYQLVARNMKTLSKRILDGAVRAPLTDPREMIPFTFIFCGPSGTGKTTTAKRMGELFYDMGFLAVKDVIECSATDLIGEYVGHTGPKTKRLFDTALGRVLFIDEAYKLAEGPYGKEAMIEMINNLTKESYRNKLVVILAGYEQDINELMSINQGLNSRFPCIDLLFKCLRNFGLDTGSLEGSGHIRSGLEKSFETLSMSPFWGNARDIQTLANMIFRRLLKETGPDLSLTVTEILISQEMNSMIDDRRMRAAAVPDVEDGKTRFDTLLQNDFRKIRIAPPVTTKAKADADTSEAMGPGAGQQELHDTGTAVNIAHENCGATTTGEGTQSPSDEGVREPGVSDEIWEQLESDKMAAKKRKMDYDRPCSIVARVADEIASSKTLLLVAPAGSEMGQRAENRLRIAEAKHEEQRAALEEKEKEEKEKEEKEKEEKEKEEKEKEEKEKEEKEKKIQELLKGKCPSGYEWIREKSGYRCAGGWHKVTFEQIRAKQIPD